MARHEEAEMRRRLRTAAIRAYVSLALVVGWCTYGTTSLPGAVLVVDDRCSLVDAIVAANTDTPSGGCPAGHPGEDVIELTTDVVLTEIDNADRGPSGLPAVSTRVRIEGNGFRVGRDPAAPEFRIFVVGQLGRLTLDSITVSGGACPDCNGGGAHVSDGGSLVVRNSTIRDNTARGETIHGDGAGIFVRNDGALTITDSTISANRTPGGWGGGLSAEGPLTLVDTSIIGNEALRGGGIYGGFPAVVVDSLIADNHADQTGGGIYLSELEMLGSTVSGNQSRADAGGIFLSFVDVTITNSTISGNITAGDGGGIYAAGISYACAAGGDVVLINSTVAGNEPNAVVVRDEATLTAKGSVLTGRCISRCEGELIDGHGNLAVEATCPRDGELTGLDPELEDNGGPTPTHALFPESSAVDAAPCLVATDQRGYARIDGSCDAGAFEVDAQPLARPSLAVYGAICPGPTVFRVAGASAGGEVSIGGSNQLGRSTVPSGPCEGTELDLREPIPLARMSVDEMGERTEVLEVSRSACGGFVQLLDLATCTTSEPFELRAAD